MTKQKVIVIGGGLSGLTAAIVAAENGDNVTILTDGAGTLPLSGGVIDVLGFTAAKKAVKNPAESIAALPATHPYHKIGIDWLKKSLAWFRDFTAHYGLPYHGDVTRQIIVATSVGTVKPTCLAPTSLDAAPLFAAKK